MTGILQHYWQSIAVVLIVTLGVMYWHQWSFSYLWQHLQGSRVVFSQNQVTFNNLSPNQEAKRTIRVANIGLSKVTIIGVIESCGCGELNSELPFNLSPGQQRELTITGHSGVKGSHQNGTIQLLDDTRTRYGISVSVNTN